jgi:hypothetical protein
VVFDVYSFRSQISVELFCVFSEHFILDVLFFVSSDSLGLCLYFLYGLVFLSIALFLWRLLHYFWEIFIFICSLILSEPVPDSAYMDSSFLQLLIWNCKHNLRPQPPEMARVRDCREFPSHRAVFLNRQAAARYRALAQWSVTNLNVILYLSTCHTVYISVLILFMIMP